MPFESTLLFRHTSSACNISWYEVGHLQECNMGFQPLITRCTPFSMGYVARTALWFDPKSSESVALEPNNAAISKNQWNQYIVLCPWSCRKSTCPLTDHGDHHRLRLPTQFQNINLQTAHHVCQHQFANSNRLQRLHVHHFRKHHGMHHVIVAKSCSE